MTMRLAIVAAVAVLGLVLAAPAHAQARGPASGGMATTAVGGTGTGGGGGGGGLGGGHSLPSFARVRYTNSAAHGTDTDFQLTSFVPYEQAVKMGETALAAPAPETKTLGQIAAEYRAAKQRHE